jgi:predicted dehydrogenase
MSRRQFLAASAAGAALASLPTWFSARAEAAAAEEASARPSKFGPNDQINIAVIGPGGSRGGFRQGLHDTKGCANHAGVKVVAACDVDSQHLDEAAGAFGPDCKKYADFRDVLGRKDIDAVVIGTPDHWHAYIAIAAMKAGKDVYCEKPLTLTLDEGKKIVRVWRETGAVFQTGSQQRSDGRFRLACQLVRNGRIGQLKKVIVHLPSGPTGGPFASGPVPEGFNWDMWLGPTAMTEYVKERTHGNFRWWLDYSGGMLTDWGAHHNDIAQWGMGTDRSGPISVEGLAKGPLIGHNCYSTFPEFDLDFTYANGVVMHVTNQGENGVQFEGENGWIFVSRSRIGASDQKLIDDPLPYNAEQLYVSNDHTGNFIDCMRSRKQPICDAEIGHRSVSISHLANICLRLGGDKLEWDPKAEQFKNNAAANAMLSRAARKQWRV